LEDTAVIFIVFASNPYEKIRKLKVAVFPPLPVVAVCVLTVLIIPTIMTSHSGPIGSLASRVETPPRPPHFSKLHMQINDPVTFSDYDFETLVLGMFRLRGKAHNAFIKPFNSLQEPGMTLCIETI
jgi:hypothetical protein